MIKKLLFLSAFVLMFQIVQAQTPGAAWPFYRSIALNAVTPSANYQIKFTLSAGQYGNMDASGDDLRFYDDSDAKCDYWIETWNTSGTSTIWIEVATLGADEINMFYGNGGASAESDADATFILHDDFSGSSVDATKWDVKTGSSSSVVISGGQLTLNSGTNDNQGAQVIAKTGFLYSEGTIVETTLGTGGTVNSTECGSRGSFSGVTSLSGNATYFGVDISSTNNYACWSIGRNSNVGSALINKASSSISYPLGNVAGLDYGQGDLIAVSLESGRVEYFSNGTSIGLSTSNTPIGTLYPVLNYTRYSCHPAVNSTLIFDEIRVRRYENSYAPVVTIGVQTMQACSISAITAGAQTPCASNTYTQDVTVTYVNAPASGTLDVNGQGFAIGTSPQTVTLTTLSANGLDVDVTAYFSDDAGCTLTKAALFTAPSGCAFSTALNFDGSNDYVESWSSTAGLLPIGNAARTVDFWVKTTQTSIGNIVAWGDRINGQRSSFAVRSGKAAFIGEFRDATGTITINDGIWHHVAISYDGLTNTTNAGIKIYVDGVLDPGPYADAWNGTNLSTTTRPLTMGRTPPPSAVEYFNGSVDELRIWDKELSFAEITAIVGKSVSVNSPNLVAYFDFEGGVANGDNSITGGDVTQVIDLTGNYNGTVHDFARIGTFSNWVDNNIVISPSQGFALMGNGAEILNGATPELNNHTNFGKSSSGVPVTRTFTITNIGVGDLTLNGSPNLVSVTGSAEFTVTSQPGTTTLTPGASTTFEVQYAATTKDQRATISIPSTDPAGTFSFEVGGSLNTALDFDGVDDVITVPNMSNNLQNTDFTLEFWMNMTNAATNGEVFTLNELGPDDKFIAKIFPDFSGMRLRFQLSGNTGGRFYNVSNLPTNTWEHFAFIKEGDVLTVYRNGVVSGSSVGAGPGDFSLTNLPLIIGSGASGFFEGTLDEVRLWDRALCQAEIVGRMNSSLQGNENGLVAYYDFEEGIAGADNTGLPSTAFDQAGTNHGTMSGFDKDNATSNWVAGNSLASVNTAMDFDGVDDNVQLQNINLGTDAVTLEAFVTLDKLPTAMPSNIGGIYDSQSDAFVLYLDKNNQELRFKVTTTNGYAERPGISQSKLTTGNWIHVAGVYDGSTKTAKIYLNGIEEDSHTSSNFSGNIMLNEVVRIGFSSTGYYDGQIDEVRVWNTARTQSEIQANMNSKLRGDESGLVAYYDFEEGVPEGDNTALTMLLDKAGSNNGTLGGFAKTGSTSNWVKGSSNVETGGIVGTLATWNGTTSTDWNIATNWTPNSIPDQCTDVVIPTTSNNPTFSNNQAVNSIEIQTDAALTVGAGGCLWVGSAFTNNGDFVLESNSSNYAQYQGPQVAGSLSQTIAEEGWHSIASPFIDAKLGDITFDQGGELIYNADPLKTNIQYYDPSKWQQTPPNSWQNAWGTWVSATGVSDAFDGSKAYNLYLDSYFTDGFPVTMTVSGTLRNMPITQELNGANGGWNQMSNPFPSVVDWDKLHDNSDIASDAYYIWSAADNNYTTYAAFAGTGTFGSTNYIAPYQSVFVKTANGANSNSGNEPDDFQDHLTSNADRPSECPSAINGFYKTSPLTGNLKLTTTNSQGLKDEMILVFNENAISTFSNAEDVDKFFSTDQKVPSLFAEVEDHACVIASYPYPSLRLESIPLGYVSTQRGTVIIEATKTPDGMTVFLEDKKLKEFHNLETPYAFTSEQDEESDRFKLHIGGENSNIVSILGGDQIVFIQDETIVFYDKEKQLGGKLLLLNIAGQELVKGTVTEAMKIDISSYAPGIYLIQVNTRGTVKTQRIIVR